MYPVQPDA